MTDLLLLAINRVSGDAVSIAGMTTEPDPVTGLRWARPVSAKPMSLEDLRYSDGSLPRLGDVVRMELGTADVQPPLIEDVDLIAGTRPLQRVRSLTAAKRGSFFATHQDPQPRDVISRTPQRSLCLVKPDELQATFAIDEDTERYEARLVLSIGKLHSTDQGILVNDLYWRAWGRQQLGDEPFVEFTMPELQELLGDIYVVITLNSKGRPVVGGVHTIPDYVVELDETKL